MDMERNKSFENIHKHTYSYIYYAEKNAQVQMFNRIQIELANKTITVFQSITQK